MKKANILCLLSAALITVSCSTDFLNTKSQTEIMAEDIWKEKNLAEAYMYDIYFAFQDAGFTEELQASACDEALFTHGREFRESNAGAVTDVNLGWFAKTQSTSYSLFVSATCFPRIVTARLAVLMVRSSYSITGKRLYRRLTA